MPKRKLEEITYNHKKGIYTKVSDGTEVKPEPKGNPIADI